VKPLEELAIERGAVAPAEPAYLTPDEFAKMVQVSEKTVYRWAANDPTMPTLRIGGVVRFPRVRLLAWLRAREQGPGRARRLRQPSPPAPQVPVPVADRGSAPSSCANSWANRAEKGAPAA
jgi:excisionase family DNA binding protein